jgi:glucose/arabinose dehydrogenase
LAARHDVQFADPADSNRNVGVARLHTAFWTVVVLLVVALAPAPASAALPAGFKDSIVISGRTNPTSVNFAPDGRILITEKSGKIWLYQSLSDTSPTLFADLSRQVDDYWDRGLLGLAVPPGFPTDNHVYVLYTYDAPINGTAPLWNDACPTPPGPTTDGCLVSGRLSQLSVSGDLSTGERVLINDWCQQFPSHSIGTLKFGSDGYLYASAGEGANFNTQDWGQFGATYSGDKANPCGDPPGTVGTALTAPTAEGGALRSQSVRRTDGPTTLDGTIIRIDPSTGAAAPGNPFAGSSDANKARVIAYGLRNPFRFTVRPGTNELWIGEVGAGTWEEIDRIPSAVDTVAENFGWPCYEGIDRSSYQAFGLNLCSTLYSLGNAVSPYYAYNHDNAVVSGDGCPTANGSSITGIAFSTGAAYPGAYNGALFFADHTRSCMWAMLAGTNGQPNPSTIVAFTPAPNPVDIESGPAALSNDLFYVDMEGGAIHRLTYSAGNQAPTASIAASPTAGAVPLTVQFSGSGSSDPEGGTLTYAWNFGDGSTSTGATVSHTYQSNGTYTARLTVTDPGGLQSSATQTITAGTPPPTAIMNVAVKDATTGAALTQYKVGDVIAFSGSGTDSTGKALPASAFSWKETVHHCPTPNQCHTHVEATPSGVTSGSFGAPDHDYPCYITIDLTVTDPGTGLTKTATQRIDPATVALTFRTNPGGLRISLGEQSLITPYTKTVIVKHQLSITAELQQIFNGQTYNWQSWSDGGQRSHVITAPSSATTYTVYYRKK